MIKGQCSLRRPIRVHHTFAHMFFMSYCVSITKTFQQFSDRYTDFTDISVTNYPTWLELNNQSKVVLLGPGDVNVEGNMKVPFGFCVTYWVNWCFSWEDPEQRLLLLSQMDTRAKRFIFLSWCTWCTFLNPWWCRGIWRRWLNRGDLESSISRRLQSLF